MRESGPNVFLVNRMMPSELHAAPPFLPVLASVSVCGRPPLMAIVFNLFPAIKPTDRLSGDQNGMVAPSVPARGCAEVELNGRTHNRGGPSAEATNTKR